MNDPQPFDFSEHGPFSLDAIEQRWSNVPKWHRGPSASRDIHWLIAEVRRLSAACEPETATPPGYEYEVDQFVAELQAPSSVRLIEAGALRAFRLTFQHALHQAWADGRRSSWETATPPEPAREKPKCLCNHESGTDCKCPCHTWWRERDLRIAAAPPTED